MLASLKLFAKNISFDELPYIHEKSDLDWDAINKIFSRVYKTVNEQKAEALELLTKHSGKNFPL